MWAPPSQLTWRVHLASLKASSVVLHRCRPLEVQLLCYLLPVWASLCLRALKVRLPPQPAGYQEMQYSNWQDLQNIQKRSSNDKRGDFAM